jgi:hypothetical protein
VQNNIRTTTDYAQPRGVSVVKRRLGSLLHCVEADAFGHISLELTGKNDYDVGYFFKTGG